MSKAKKIRVVIKNVNENGKVVEVDNELQTFQNIVNGHIQTYPFVNGMLIICNEEGKLMNLEENFSIPLSDGYVEQIVGNVIFVSMDGDEFASLSDENISFLGFIGVC